VHVLQDKSIKTALVFTRTKHGADKINRDIIKAGIRSNAIHGNKSQNARQSALSGFKEGRLRVLVATDIAARGIDVDNLSHVINYDLPDEAENYVHRVGRTGRGTQKGHAVSFCSEEERPVLKEIENYLSKPVRVIEVKKEDYSQTLLHTEDTTDNWKLLLREAAALDKTKPKKKNNAKRI
jgi:ATP-dependent RNA helicase RhlE